MICVDQVSPYEDGVFVLGFSDANWDGLIVQMPVSDEQVADNPTYCVGSSIDQDGVEGGVLEVRLSADVLTLEFTEEAAGVLSMPTSTMKWPVNLSSADRELCERDSPGCSAMGLTKSGPASSSSSGRSVDVPVRRSATGRDASNAMTPE